MFPYAIDVEGKKSDVQSVYCVGRNYLEHINELKNKPTESPMIFIKPKGAILLTDKIHIPSNTNDLHHECELVISIGKAGENISEDKALEYISGITIGIDFTARDLQETEKKNGHSWTLSKCQKGFAALGQWQKFAKSEYGFHLDINGGRRQTGDSNHMRFNFSKIIAYLSSLVPLYEGDIIYTGTPAGVSQVKTGDLLEGYIDGKKALRLGIV